MDLRSGLGATCCLSTRFVLVFKLQVGGNCSGPWLEWVIFRGDMPRASPGAWFCLTEERLVTGRRSQAWEFPTIENVTWTLIYQSQPITLSPRRNVENRSWSKNMISNIFYQRWTLFLWAPLNWNNLRLGKTLRRCEPLIRGLKINSENFKNY